MKYLNYWICNGVITNTYKYHGFSRKGSGRDAIKEKIITNKLVKHMRVHDIELLLMMTRIDGEETESSSNFLNTFWESANKSWCNLIIITDIE